MITCSKTYADIPFAHRQPKHDGHCAWIHGHNWTLQLTFGCEQTDENDFVLDFGKLKYLRQWIETHLDHAFVYNEDDCESARLVAAHPELFKPYVVKSCSCEGLARHIFEVFDALVREQSAGRAWLVQVTLSEDARNSATYRLK